MLKLAPCFCPSSSYFLFDETQKMFVKWFSLLFGKSAKVKKQKTKQKRTKVGRDLLLFLEPIYIFTSRPHRCRSRSRCRCHCEWLRRHCCCCKMFNSFRESTASEHILWISFSTTPWGSFTLKDRSFAICFKIVF